VFGAGGKRKLDRYRRSLHALKKKGAGVLISGGAGVIAFVDGETEEETAALAHLGAM